MKRGLVGSVTSATRSSLYTVEKGFEEDISGRRQASEVFLSAETRKAD